MEKKRDRAQTSRRVREDRRKETKPLDLFESMTERRKTGRRQGRHRRKTQAERVLRRKRRREKERFFGKRRRRQTNKRTKVCDEASRRERRDCGKEEMEMTEKLEAQRETEHANCVQSAHAF